MTETQVASQIRSLASESHRDEVRAFFFFFAMCRWARAKTSSRGRLLEVGQFAKDLKARIDFFPGQPLKALRAEALDRERSHNSTIEQGALQHLAGQFFLRGDVPH